MSKEILASSLNMAMRLVSETAAVIITTILSILAIVVIVGTSLVCLMVKRNKDLRYEEVTLPGLKIFIVLLLLWSCVAVVVTVFCCRCCCFLLVDLGRHLAVTLKAFLLRRLRLR